MRDMHLIEDNYSSSHILSSATGGKRIWPLSKNLPLRVTGQKGTQKDESIAHLRFLGCIPESCQRAASIRLALHRRLKFQANSEVCKLWSYKQLFQAFEWPWTRRWYFLLRVPLREKGQQHTNPIDKKSPRGSREDRILRRQPLKKSQKIIPKAILLLACYFLV